MVDRQNGRLTKRDALWAWAKLAPEQRGVQRRAVLGPWLADFFRWAEEIYAVVRGARGPLAAAFGYVLRQQAPLSRYGGAQSSLELTEPPQMSILIDMKRVTIAEAKQTLPALVHEAERQGEIELTRRGKPVAYLVSAEQHARIPRRGFIESLNQWLAAYAGDLGQEPLELPRRRPARKVELPR